MPSYVPPRPAFDSEPQLTRVTPPDPSLIALTRHGNTLAMRKRGRVRAAIAWFALGTLTGGVAVWGVTSDVRADVYRARIWAAETLRALHSQTTGEATDAPVVATPAPAPGSASPEVAPPQDVPTVDVGQLPRSHGDDPSSSAPPPPGAPTLTSAPGPR